MPKFRKCPNCNAKQGSFWIKKMNKKGTTWECKSCQSMLMENKYVLLVAIITNAIVPLCFIYVRHTNGAVKGLLFAIIPILIGLAILYILPLRIADSSKEN
ncbi:MAG: hypothetical protein P8I93_03580 [Crocinitomicaceae bacterium]|nr:hypothetical protein [Crocinitomicaceae bacterium]